MRWGLWEGSGEYLEGAVEETDDPNVYVLMDGLNRLYAIVHVSITDTTGGCIFVSFNGTDYSAYEKIAIVRVRDLGSE